MRKKLFFYALPFSHACLASDLNLCFVPYCRGDLLQFYKLRYRDAAALDRPEELSTDGEGSNLLAGITEFDHISNRNTDGYGPLYRGCHYRQS